MGVISDLLTLNKRLDPCVSRLVSEREIDGGGGVSPDDDKPVEILKKRKLEPAVGKNKNIDDKCERKKKANLELFEENEHDVSTTVAGAEAEGNLAFGSGDHNKKNLDDTREKQERTIFVGNLPVELYTNKGLRKLRKEFSTFGEIESIRFRSVPRDPQVTPFKKAIYKKTLAKNSYNMNAYIVYEKECSAQRALEYTGREFFGHRLRVDRIIGPKINTRKSVFVGGLPFNVNEDKIHRLFSKIGEISYVRVPRDRQTKIGRGIAYVCFKKKVDAVSAIKLNETKFEGREIRIFPSKKASVVSGPLINKRRAYRDSSAKESNKKYSLTSIEGRRATINKKVTHKLMKVTHKSMKVAHKSMKVARKSMTHKSMKVPKNNSKKKIRKNIHD